MTVLARIGRAIWPYSRGRMIAQTMMSAVADSLGLRDGVLVADHIGTGFDPNGMWIGLLRAEPVERVRQRLLDRAAAMGYRLGPHPGMVQTATHPDIELHNSRAWHFERTRSLPNPTISLYGPGCSMYGFTVPADATGIRADIDISYTMTDRYGSRKRLNPEAVARMAELNIDVTPPSWQRFWFWLGIRTCHHLRLFIAARLVGGYRGDVVASWFIGVDVVGPYTLGIATIRSATHDRITKQIAARARALGYNLGHGLREVAQHPTEPRQGRVTVQAITYGPGETMPGADRVTVPAGSTGTILTVSASQRRPGNRSATAPGPLPLREP